MKKGVAIVALWFKARLCLGKDAGLIPGLSQWVKDLALLPAMVQVTEAALIQCCCGCDVGRQLQLRFNFYPGNFHMPKVQL